MGNHRNMRYVFAFWAVLIVGAVGWGLATRINSVFDFSSPNQGKVEAVTLDESANLAKEAVDKIISNSRGSSYRTKYMETAEVIKVFDGDTIEVYTNGDLMIVGYLGIDAPTLEFPADGSEPFAIEALERNRDIVEGQQVWLERDMIKQDESGRHLRYVYVGELMVNALLLYEGLARADTSSLALKHADIIRLVEQQAITDRRGAWLRDWSSASGRR